MSEAASDFDATVGTTVINDNYLPLSPVRLNGQRGLIILPNGLLRYERVLPR